MNSALLIIELLVFLFSVIIHEVSHGAVAEALGDPTARLAGRITLNPLKHIDPIGTVLLPLLLVFAGSPVLFGWARPVPYNPLNLRDKRWDPVKVAFAGPMANILVAFTCAGFYRIAGLEALLWAVLVNVLLAVFNLVPIPPLDGSKFLYAAFRISYRTQILFEQYGFFLVFLLIYLFSGQINVVTRAIAMFLTGASL